MASRRLRRVGALLVAWAAVALPSAGAVFASSEEETTLAGHESVVSPTFDGYATLDLGPYLPNLRYPTERFLGAHIDFGKTNLTSFEALINRYTVIGAQPRGEIAKVTGALADMAISSAVTGAALGLVGPGLWVLVGPRRRAELAEQLSGRRGVAAGAVAVVLVGMLVQPWEMASGVPEPDRTEWRPLADELPGVPIPDQARPLEVEGGLFTSGTKRIAESLLDSYAKGNAFYSRVADSVPAVAGQIRQPAEDETVALLVSDRHDNVGMDKVARALADAGGATVLLAAGDDTSTGSTWEAFSLDSLNEVFADYAYRYAVTGNHDQGEFVGDYLADLGFTRPDGELAEGPDGLRILGADDPRSSGLGAWRDEQGLSFQEHEQRVADLACEYDEQGDRISTLLTHDANTGREALRRGCVDLVVGGHLHEQVGPREVVGANGSTGYTYTNGTTGGAAYAIAIGSKLRRNAMVTLVTYRDGRPVGVQPVTVRTNGTFAISPFIELDPPPGPEEPAEDTADEATEQSSGPSSEPSSEPSSGTTNPDAAGTTNGPREEEAP